MNLNAEYWNERYLSGSTGWDIGGPSPALMHFLERTVPKDAQVLIPGAGNAYEAIEAFRKGYKHIFVIDWAPEARKNFLEKYSDFPPDQYLSEDFFEHQGHYDFILEQTFFCALDPSLRMNYVKQMHRLLKPGGMLAGLWFDWDFEGGPPFGGHLNEYKTLFSPVFTELAAYPCAESIAPRTGREVWMEWRQDN